MTQADGEALRADAAAADAEIDAAIDEMPIELLRKRLRACRQIVRRELLDRHELRSYVHDMRLSAARSHAAEGRALRAWADRLDTLLLTQRATRSESATVYVVVTEWNRPHDCEGGVTVNGVAATAFGARRISWRAMREYIGYHHTIYGRKHDDDWDADVQVHELQVEP